MPGLHPYRTFSRNCHSIIDLLAAILFPVFARARENAKRAACQSNLKQLALALIMYTNDNDEAFPFSRMEDAANTPPGGYWKTTTATAWYWPQLIYPYHKSLQVFACPSSQVSDKYFSYGGQNYGVNWLISSPQDMYYAPSGGGSTLDTRYYPIKQARLAAPAVTYMCFDSGHIDMHPCFVDEPTNTFYVPGTGELMGYPEAPNGIDDTVGLAAGGYTHPRQDFLRGRHFGGVNMGFADGHVKWLKSAKVLDEGRTCGLTTTECGTGGFSPQGFPQFCLNPSAWDPAKPPQ